jgi:ubiquinone/menaquinone biosynthesis C-methylase UbiE
MFAHPETILSGFDLKSGMHVADLGTGSGFYALAAAHLVGSKGRVYAIDVQKDLLDRIMLRCCGVT